LEEYPLVTYDAGYRERLPVETDDDTPIDLNIAMSAVDTDVIKTYVRLGFGIGVIATMAYDPGSDDDLVALDASHLFTSSTTCIGCRKGTFLRKFMLEFVELFAPHLTSDLVNLAFATANPKEREALFTDVLLPHR